MIVIFQLRVRVCVKHRGLTLVRIEILPERIDSQLLLIAFAILKDRADHMHRRMEIVHGRGQEFIGCVQNILPAGCVRVIQNVQQIVARAPELFVILILVQPLVRSSVTHGDDHRQHVHAGSELSAILLGR